MIELNGVELCARLKALLLVNGKTLQVNSVFASAVNMIGDDIFFSLLSDIHCLFPMSCRVANDIPFTKYGIREGMEVNVSEGRIIISKADLTVNLKHGRERDLSFDNIEGLLVPEDLSLRVELLKELIREYGCENDLSTLITGKYKNPYADLIRNKLSGLKEAIKEGAMQAGEQAGRFSGCGIGLTPSSDDLLIGYISAYLADTKAKGRSCEAAYKITKAMGDKAAEHTNTISGAFLKQCGRGLFSEDMRKLMCSLYSDFEVEIVRKYGQRIQNFGSTSGIDMLTGVVLAIDNLNLLPRSGNKFMSK